MGSKVGKELSDTFDEWINGARMKRKQGKVDQVNMFFDPLSDPSIVEAPLNALQKIIDTMSKPIAFINANGTLYTNLPAAE